MERPPWIKKRIPLTGLSSMETMIKEMNLHTVCQSADCPNMGECFSNKTATFMILGGVCTRSCRFCSVEKKGSPSPYDLSEAQRVAEAVSKLGLEHAVITSVTRDDLPDGGAMLFAETILAIRKKMPSTTVEVLVPDFQENLPALLKIFQVKPEVFSHNVETIKSFYPHVRPEANYERSLRVLKKGFDYGGMAIKSGFMVGLGETREEVQMLLEDLARNGVSIVTIGQYLQPSPFHIPIVEYVRPEVYEVYTKIAYEVGIKYVIAGPLVRSSYRAAAAWKDFESTLKGNILK